jgi:hypothetical protein
VKCLEWIQPIGCFVVLVSQRLTLQERSGFIYLVQDLNIFQLGNLPCGQLMQQVAYTTLMVSTVLIYNLRRMWQCLSMQVSISLTCSFYRGGRGSRYAACHIPPRKAGQCIVRAFEVLNFRIRMHAARTLYEINRSQMLSEQTCKFHVTVSTWSTW